ncbi:MAG: metal ABC transporter solute-binding protein, Zn/Mn family [Anaerolineae bacterium]
MRIWIIVLVALLATGCAGATTPQDSTASGKFKVVATYSILGDFVQNVGGDEVEARTLVGAGGDAHTFEPSPADGVALVEAQLVLENGLAFETWLDDLYASSRSKAPRSVVTEGIEPIASEEEHGEFNPHIWHDVTHAIRMVQNVRDALVKADPAKAQVYQSNADAYVAQLQELDAWVSEQVKALPEDRRKLVILHDTFAYFAARYDFEIVGTALGSITTEVTDLSAGEIAELVEDIKAAGVPAIFAENISNPKLMEQIAHEAGVTLAPTLYTDALGEPGSAGETYRKMIRYNVTTIVTALSQ